MVSSRRALGLLLCLMSALVEGQLLGGGGSVGGMQTGALQTIKPSDKNVRAIVAQAMVKVNNESNDSNWLKVDAILSAKVQVVSGMRYLIEVRLRRTKCLKSKSPRKCRSYNSVVAGKTQKCQLEIWSQPWMNFLQVTKTCPPPPH